MAVVIYIFWLFWEATLRRFTNDYDDQRWRNDERIEVSSENVCSNWNVGWLGKVLVAGRKDVAKCVRWLIFTWIYVFTSSQFLGRVETEETTGWLWKRTTAFLLWAWRSMIGWMVGDFANINNNEQKYISIYIYEKTVPKYQMGADRWLLSVPRVSALHSKDRSLFGNCLCSGQPSSYRALPLIWLWPRRMVTHFHIHSHSRRRQRHLMKWPMLNIFRWSKIKGALPSRAEAHHIAEGNIYIRVCVSYCVGLSSRVEKVNMFKCVSSRGSSRFSSTISLELGEKSSGSEEGP